MIKKALGLVSGLLVCLGVVSGAFFSSNNYSSSAVYKKASVQEANRQEAFSDLTATDLTIVDDQLTFTIKTATFTSIYQSYNYIIDVGTSDNSYFLGYYGEGEESKPLTFYYDVKTVSGTVEERSTKMNRLVSNNIYDAVGSDLAGQTSFSNDADLPIAEGEKVDMSSLKVTNIFKVSASNSAYPDFSTTYYLANPIISTIAKTNYDFSDFMDVSFTGLSSFMGYTSIECNYTSSILKMYKSAYDGYSSHASKIEAGTEYLRIRFGSLTNSSCKVNLKGGSYYLNPITGTTSLTINDEGHFKFLLSGFKTADVESFELVNPTIAVDLMNSSTKKVVVGTSKSFRFGSIPFNSTGKVNNISYNMLLIFFTLGFTVIFAAADYGIYRYKKEKYKNDEFNRVVPKEFLKKNIMGYAYLTLWLEEIIVLVGRTTSLNNSLVVFNPFDAFIVAFSIALIIYTGYYIKYFIVKFKDYQTKTRDKKLKIDENAASDDGTVVVKK